MEQSQRGTNNGSSNTPSATSSLMPNVLFREIHKNAFLKRHSSDRRAGFPRKSEKVWVVFCVHDDVEPFLEIYPDQKVALTHKPEWFASLSNVLHVSPTICGHEDEFEFAVTLSFQVVRLSAPTWESMMEWVETIRNKLRELKVLCPKENIYSKMPEQKQILLPTRDPNSPLPLPPEGPSTLLPGVEIVHLEPRNNSQVSETDIGRHLRDGNIRPNLNHERRPSKRRENLAEREARPTAESSQTPESSNTNIETAGVALPSVAGPQNVKPKAKRALSVPQQMPSTSNIPSSSNITVIEVSASNNRNTFSLSECNASLDNFSDNEEGDDVFLVSQDVKTSSAVENSSDEAHYEHVFLPCAPTKPQVASTSDCKSSIISPPTDINKVKKIHSTSVMINPNLISKHSSHEESVASTSRLVPSSNVKNILINNSTCVNVSGNLEIIDSEESDKNEPLSPQIQTKLEKVNISGLIPRIPAKSGKLSAFKPAIPIIRDTNLNVIENKKCSLESESQPSGSTDQGERTNEENSVVIAAGVSTSPTYSQVKKVPKSKIKSENVRNGGSASPILPKRKTNEVLLVEGEPERNKKSEGSGIAKIPNGKPSQKVSKKPESGNSNVNKEISNVSNSEYKNELSHSAPSTSGNRVDNSCRINVAKKDQLGLCNNNPEVEPIIATVQPTVGVISVEEIPLIGGHQRRRRRSSSSDAVPASNTPSSRGIGGADRIRIHLPLTTGISSRESNRNEGDSRVIGHGRNGAEQNPVVNIAPQSSRLTLREQQVLQLKKEMLHPGGVRLQLRRKDCTGSMALVDVLNGVWVAGWKQKEHPLLYNAFHIGDQIISIGDVVVRSSVEAQKVIRSSTSLYIEFIIRRVPFGNVFALQRTSDGQSLGIVQEGNTAEIKDIVPNSIAARQGLSPMTTSSDGLSLTTWFLTEINGRPLNLFFKDNEVRDRLNAVGKEISILVQPHDFIKQIKKQLKNIRSYKDYIVQ